jgi:hypothetical protein
MKSGFYTCLWPGADMTFDRPIYHCYLNLSILSWEFLLNIKGHCHGITYVDSRMDTELGRKTRDRNMFLQFYRKLLLQCTCCGDFRIFTITQTKIQNRKSTKPTGVRHAGDTHYALRYFRIVC